MLKQITETNKKKNKKGVEMDDINTTMIIFIFSFLDEIDFQQADNLRY